MNDGSTHVAFGFLIGFSLDFGLTTVSSCFLIWLDMVRDHTLPTFPMSKRSFPSPLPRYKAAPPVGSFTKPMTGNFPCCTVLIFSHASFRSDRYGASAFLEMMPSSSAWQRARTSPARRR